MHEKDFNLLEGRTITLPELGREIENITGRQIKDSDFIFFCDFKDLTLAHTGK